jgi:hypothetical protein
MRIRLIDIDSKIPNLALMKLSAYYKGRGHTVSFDEPDPNLVFASVVFRKNAWKALSLHFMFPNAEIEIGGTGVDLAKRLPDAVEFCKPDYDLYPGITYSLGYTTRGCIRRCPFCVVPEKEGKIQRWQHIREWHDERFDTVICLDNNVYADREWFFENTDYVLESGLKYNAIQGMDIRILDEEIAGRLADLKWSGQLHFAFDRIQDEPAIRRGIQLLQDAGIRTRHDVSVYVLVGFDSTEEEDKRRCRLLKDLGVTPFVMQYKRTPWTRRVAWWANRPQVFWSCDIDQVDRSKNRVTA